MERSLSMELVSVTEAAGVAAARWMGRGLKNEADDAATTAMRMVFDTIPMQGVVVIGEGEMDEAPMLYIGEELGMGSGGPQWTSQLIRLKERISLHQAAGTHLQFSQLRIKVIFLHAPDMYMNKIAVGPEAVGKIDIDASVTDNLLAVARAKNKDIEDVVATVLNRDRHLDIIEEIRAAGARIKLIKDGDVAGAINTALMEQVLIFYSAMAELQKVLFPRSGLNVSAVKFKDVSSRQIKQKSIDVTEWVSILNKCFA